MSSHVINVCSLGREAIPPNSSVLIVLLVMDIYFPVKEQEMINHRVFNSVIFLAPCFQMVVVF